MKDVYRKYGVRRNPYRDGQRFSGEQGIELAPGPKELMNMQRFYLYLNLTKPSERLCLSYSMSNGKGEATGPAFLIRTSADTFSEA